MNDENDWNPGPNENFEEVSRFELQHTPGSYIFEYGDALTKHMDRCFQENVPPSQIEKRLPHPELQPALRITAGFMRKVLILPCEVELQNYYGAYIEWILNNP